MIERIFPNRQHVDNYEHARLGRIWILFDADIRLHVHSSSSEAMHCHVYSQSVGKYFFLSFIYVSNDEIDRRDLWAELRLMDELLLPSPWLALGSFNVVLQRTDCSDYFSGMAIPNKVQDFQCRIGDVGLVDILGFGPVLHG